MMTLPDGCISVIGRRPLGLPLSTVRYAPAHYRDDAPADHWPRAIADPEGGRPLMRHATLITDGSLVPAPRALASVTRCLQHDPQWASLSFPAVMKSMSLSDPDVALVALSALESDSTEPVYSAAALLGRCTHLPSGRVFVGILEWCKAGSERWVRPSTTPDVIRACIIRAQPHFARLTDRWFLTNASPDSGQPLRSAAVSVQSGHLMLSRFQKVTR